MPESHGTGRQQARRQHQYRGGRNGTGRSLPASGQAGPEGAEDGNETKISQGEIGDYPLGVTSWGSYLSTKAAMTERAKCRRAMMSSLNEGEDLSSSVCGK